MKTKYNKYEKTRQSVKQI